VTDSFKHMAGDLEDGLLGSDLFDTGLDGLMEDDLLDKVRLGCDYTYFKPPVNVPGASCAGGRERLRKKGGAACLRQSAQAAAGRSMA